MKFASRGFSVIEILIVLCIMGIALSIVLSSFFALNDEQSLEKEAHAVEDVFEQARMNTIASRYDYSYGVHLTATATILFKCVSSPCQFSSADTTNSIRSLASKVRLSYTLSGGGQDIVFSKITGTPSATGTLTFSLLTDATKTKSLTIYGTGVTQSN